MRSVTYLVVADDGNKDVVLGSFETLPDAQEAVLAYRATRADAFCWIEQGGRQPADPVGS